MVNISSKPTKEKSETVPVSSTQNIFIFFHSDVKNQDDLSLMPILQGCCIQLMLVGPVHQG